MNWEKIAELKVIYVQPPTGSKSVIASRKADPYDYVVSVNERRRHLSTAQRSEVAEKLLKARPDLSDAYNRSSRPGDRSRSMTPNGSSSSNTMASGASAISNWVVAVSSRATATS